MSLFDQVAATARPTTMIDHSTRGTFCYEFSKGRVYEFPLLRDAVGFADKFGGRFVFGIAAPVDRHVIVLD